MNVCEIIFDSIDCLTLVAFGDECGFALRLTYPLGAEGGELFLADELLELRDGEKFLRLIEEVAPDACTGECIADGSRVGYLSCAAAFDNFPTGNGGARQRGVQCILFDTGEPYLDGLEFGEYVGKFLWVE